MVGPRLGEVAEAVEARAPRRVTLRPFAPFSGATEGDGGGGDWSFIDCEMEEEEEEEMERMKRPKPKIIQTRRPEYTPIHLS